MEFGKERQRIDPVYSGDNGTSTGTHYDALITEISCKRVAETVG